MSEQINKLELMQKDRDAWESDCLKLGDRVTRLTALNAELVEALGELHDACMDQGQNPVCHHLGPYVLLARAALAKAKGADSDEG